MKHAIPFLIVLLALALAAGCTGPAPAATPTPAPAVTENTAVPVTTTPLPAATTVTSSPSRPVLTATTATVGRMYDPPYIDYLNAKKRTFDYPIPNCVMQKAFPAIITDSYGIRQVVPRLSQLSEDDYLYFLRKNTEGNAENTKLKTPDGCSGAPADPTWNFVEVRAVIKPTNIRATNYTITENVLSEGKTVASFVSTERMIVDKDVNLVSYIPVKESEMNLFDSVTLEFVQHP